MTHVQRALVAGALAATCAFAARSANATLIIDASVGGAPIGTSYSYANFDNLPLGYAGGASGGIGVSFTTDGGVVSAASSGRYAAPILSNSNGVLFGDSTVSGEDRTLYLSTGIGTVTFSLPGLQSYFGLLWGSVDWYNSMQFYNGATLVGSLTGTDVTANANGSLGASGTYYVNITSTLPFDRVVALSTSYAFEIDNVAYGNPGIRSEGVPEPLTIGLLGLGILGLGVLRCRR